MELNGAQRLFADDDADSAFRNIINGTGHADSFRRCFFTSKSSGYIALIIAGHVNSGMGTQLFKTDIKGDLKINRSFAGRLEGSNLSLENEILKFKKKIGLKVWSEIFLMLF